MRQDRWKLYLKALWGAVIALLVISCLINGLFGDSNSLNTVLAGSVYVIINLGVLTLLFIIVVRLNPDRIGFVGHSFGALIGGILTGVDRRLRAAVLMAGTGRFADVAAVNLPDLSGERLEHYHRTLAELDPAVWVGRAAPAALLFQSALRDEFFTEEQAREFFERASDPKSLEWYDAGHFLDEAARRDRIAWLAGHLSLDGSR